MERTNIHPCHTTVLVFDTGFILVEPCLKVDVTPISRTMSLYTTGRQKHHGGLPASLLFVHKASYIGTKLCWSIYFWASTTLGGGWGVEDKRRKSTLKGLHRIGFTHFWCSIGNLQAEHRSKLPAYVCSMTRFELYLFL